MIIASIYELKTWQFLYDILNMTAARFLVIIFGLMTFEVIPKKYENF